VEGLVLHRRPHRHPQCLPHRPDHLCPQRTGILESGEGSEVKAVSPRFRVLSKPCHPERSSCFAEREAATESKDLLLAGAKMNAERNFHDALGRGENSQGRLCLSSSKAGPSSALSSASPTTTSVRMTECVW